MLGTHQGDPDLALLPSLEFRTIQSCNIPVNQETVMANSAGLLEQCCVDNRYVVVQERYISSIR